MQLVNLGPFRGLTSGLNKVAHGIGGAVIAIDPKSKNGVNKGLHITGDILDGAG